MGEKIKNEREYDMDENWNHICTNTEITSQNFKEKFPWNFVELLVEPLQS